MNLFIVFLLCGSSVFCSPPIVRVKQGEISGTYHTLSNGRVINAFLGVPYAEPPVQKYRFKEPCALESWTGTWNASSTASICLQYDHFSYEIIGEEDCLYLNVFTPKLLGNGTEELLDVMVLIHPGAFMFASGNKFYPEYILQNHDLVYVSMNYRLGALGFLSTGDNVIPGNNGLKDQVVALKWINQNIINFGGNPASITIFGCSAGGASVHYHFMSPLSDGLFQKGVSLSGTVLPEWTLPKNNTEKSFYLATLLGCPSTSTANTLTCLQERSAKQILEAAKYFQPWHYSPFTAFGPVVEPIGANRFLSEEPLELLNKGKMKNLPWLTSLCKNEGLYPAAEFIENENAIRELNEKWNELAPHLLMYNYSVFSDTKRDEVSAALRKFYFGDDSISKETIQQIVQALGDRAFFNDITRAIKLHTSTIDQNVFCYFFNYRGKYSTSDLFTTNFNNHGVSHADDLNYILKFSEYSSQETKSDKAMTKFMTSLIFNFIRTGNQQNFDTRWTPVSKNKNDNLRCLFIQSPDEQKMDEFKNQRTFEQWKNLLPSEYLEEEVSKLEKDEL